MSAALARRGTPLDEYLALEAAAVGQKPNLEYDGNDIVLMAGASEAHFKIVANLGDVLRPQFRPRGCTSGGSDLRVKTETTYRYPDYLAYCPPAHFTNDRPPSLLNPLLLVEVLSETTTETDFTLKLQEYTSVESVQEYWIVGVSRPVVYRYVRAPEAWLLYVHDGLEGAFESAALAISVKLADVYDGVDFAPASADEPGVEGG